MKFLADMGISPRTVAWLQQAGYTARHLYAEGLERLPLVIERYSAAWAEGAIITVTKQRIRVRRLPIWGN